VPLLPTDIVRFEIERFAFGHVSIWFIPHIQSRRDILIVAPAIKDLAVVKMDLKKTLAIPAAHSIAILVPDFKGMISRRHTHLAGFVFKLLFEASFGLMHQSFAGLVGEFPRGVVGVFIGAGFDFDIDVAAEAAGEGVEEVGGWGWFGRWLEGRLRGWWFRRR